MDERCNKDTTSNGREARVNGSTHANDTQYLLKRDVITVETTVSGENVAVILVHGVRAALWSAWSAT